MRAVVLDDYGPPGNLRLTALPDPSLRSRTDVRVAVQAAAVNPIDWKIRSGLERGLIRLRLPAILGFDFAGTVVEIGADVMDLAVGDPVMGNAPVLGPGSYAEQVVVDQRMVIRRPPPLSVAAAAGLPLAGLTAYQGLFPRLTDRANPRVFVQAGSGGVGHLAIQIAKHHGAFVATTTSDRNREFVSDLGADQVIDYRSENWWETLTDIDIAIESLGGPHRDRTFRVMRRGGRIASINSDLTPHTQRYGPLGGLVATGATVASWVTRGRLRGLQAVPVVRRMDRTHLGTLAQWAADGVIHVALDRTFALEDLPEAHRFAETGRTRGKLIVSVA